MKEKTKIIIIISISSIILFSALSLWVAYRAHKEAAEDFKLPDLPGSDWVAFFFDSDFKNKTLTASILVYSGDAELIWENMEISNGAAVLPTGKINEGDVITNCSGDVCLKWKPTNETVKCFFFPDS